ncbi:hypothetical protein DDB_G0285327 [Dictyostelium discoideum AX4]|nr:hypothetical protein DDB_G0285327 [Dictyostelium discoideum AX4]EAL64738.1 hypothetical protein DDB_G0285327 [Dictyostelium discoideum AX4]|eukprot:XP_638239.1 hypothetical protein DDB_G0285327 [Dictyostelium discoideum AX4]
MLPVPTTTMLPVPKVSGEYSKNEEDPITYQPSVALPIIENISNSNY